MKALPLRKMMLVAIGLAMTLPAIAEDGCTSVIKFEATSSISMNSLGWFASPKSISSARGAIVLWPFDEENQPVQAEWAAIGVVLANSGDVGAHSVGGVVWVKKAMLSMVKIDMGSDPTAFATFSFGKESLGCKQGLKFEITNNSEVRFGDRIVGKIN